MKNILEKWHNIGFLEITPEERKEFVSNTLELSIAYLNYSYNHSENKKRDNDTASITIAIIIRIANHVDFGFNDFFLILSEIKNNLFNLNKMNDEEELKFCVEFSENKINELKNI